MLKHTVYYPSCGRLDDLKIPTGAVLYIQSDVAVVDSLFSGSTVIKFTKKFSNMQITSAANRLRITTKTSAKTSNIPTVALKGDFQSLKIRMTAKVVQFEKFSCTVLYPGRNSDCLDLLKNCKSLGCTDNDDEYPDFLFTWYSDLKIFSKFVEISDIHLILDFIKKAAHVLDDPTDSRLNQYHLLILKKHVEQLG